MKKFLTSLLVVCMLLTACFVSAVPASAATASPESDFEVYDGVLIDYLGAGGDVVIPESLEITEIDSQVFSKCAAAQEITSVIVPDGVTKIGYACFEYCANLEKVLLPRSLEELGGSAFRFCTSLTSIAIPGSVTHLVGDTFAGDTALTTVKLEEGLEIVDTYVFCAVPAKQIVFPSTVYELAGGVANNLTLEEQSFIIMNPDCKFLHVHHNDRDTAGAAWMTTFAGTEQYKTRCTVKSLADSNVKTEVLKDGEHYSYINFVAMTAENMQKEYEKQAPTDADFSPVKGQTSTDTDADTDTDTDKKPSSNKKNDATSTDSGSKDNTALLLIVLIAAVVFIILIVVVLVVLFATGVIGGKKPTKKVKEVAPATDVAPAEEIAEEAPAAEETPAEDENN